MKSRAFTLVEILIVISIVTILTTGIALVVLRQRAIVFETIAQRTLQTAGLAMEHYAMGHDSMYPLDMTSLTTPTPPYLNENYCDGQVRQGYIYTRSGEPPQDTFVIEANPSLCHVTGNKRYAIRSGMASSESDCD